MMRTIFLTLNLLFLATISFGQTYVTTVVDSSAFPFTDDLIFDAQGNLYCADYSGAAVFKRSPNGTITEFASGFNTPNGLAFDSYGNLFVCDNLGNAIYKLSNTGVFLDTFLVSKPSGIIKDQNSDTLIFTTYGSQSTLKKLAPNGTIVDFHAGAPLVGPVGLSYCQGELYVANFDNRKIYHVLPDTLIFIAQLPGSGSLGFITTLGNALFATAFNGHKIYSVNLADSSVTLYAGSTGGSVDGPIESAKFITPNGIVVNATEDTMYVSEYNGKRLRMITGFTVGVEAIFENIEAKLYPNPLNDALYIEDVPVPFSIRITDLNGKVVFEEEQVFDKQSGFQLSHLESGSYTVTVISGNSEISERVIKME